MSTPPDRDSSRRLTEDEAHALLARAAELDARLPSTVTVDELWSSAAAAGISREAFEMATADLRAGKIGRARGRVAVGAALVRSGQVVFAVALFYAAFRTPNYSGWWIAQSIGAAWAIYGAYKSVGFAARWFGGLRGRPLPARHSKADEALDNSPRSDTSMAVRVLNLQQSATGAA